MEVHFTESKSYDSILIWHRLFNAEFVVHLFNLGDELYDCKLSFGFRNKIKTIYIEF